MRIHSDHDASRERLNGFKRYPGRFVIVELEGAQSVRGCDHAQERLAEGATPGAHRPHVATAWEGRAIGVRVQKADDIAMRLFALQGPRAVEAYAAPLATGVAYAPTMPD